MFYIFYEIALSDGIYQQEHPVNVKHSARCAMGKAGRKPKEGEF